MKRNLILYIALGFVLLSVSCHGKKVTEEILTGAEQPDIFIPILSDKNIALMVNHTSMIGENHLVDFLLMKNIRIKKIFAVEHGFRGTFANGETFTGNIDPTTGLEIVSLYGETKKATAKDLQGIDIVVFDIQDVGCRFYTYINSMFYLMEACAENKVPLIILDRPNPNGDYVDGPVLDTTLRSFVGLLPIPIVHGCTVGELALMINGEKWLNNELTCDLKIVNVKNYTHNTPYELPVKPSPNLPNTTAIRLYPSLCLFEATQVSIGRGTPFPFQVIGYPDSTISDFNFRPEDIHGVSTQTLHAGNNCYGLDLRNLNNPPEFTLGYFIDFFQQINDPDLFWKSKRWIELLTGDKQFYHQINKGWTEDQIKASWQPALEQYRETRKKYLLYPDFE
jgi:uncharacterized protein YbbC (DUF1343 family)